MGLFGRSARANEEESLVQKPHEDLPDLSEKARGPLPALRCPARCGAKESSR